MYYTWMYLIVINQSSAVPLTICWRQRSTLNWPVAFTRLCWVSTRAAISWCYLLPPPLVSEMNRFIAVTDSLLLFIVCRLSPSASSVLTRQLFLRSLLNSWDSHFTHFESSSDEWWNGLHLLKWSWSCNSYCPEDFSDACSCYNATWGLVKGRWSGGLKNKTTYPLLYFLRLLYQYVMSPPVEPW